MLSRVYLGKGANARAGALELARRRMLALALADERARVAAGCTPSQWHAAKRCEPARTCAKVRRDCALQGRGCCLD